MPNICFLRQVSCLMAFLMFLIGVAPRVDAGFAPSELMKGFSHSERTADLQKIQKMLEMKAVKERLGNLGFTESEIQKRLNELSDEQIHYFAQNIDQLQTGGNGLGIVIALLVIAILVVLLIQLTGHRVIVK
jgi:hypothetical protein